jgi:hypothetical protein
MAEPGKAARITDKSKAGCRAGMSKLYYMTDFQGFGNGLPFESLFPI